MKKIKEPRMTNDASAKCSLFYLVDFQTSTRKDSQEQFLVGATIPLEIENGHKIA